MVIKMKDLIRAQGDVLRKQYMWTEADDEKKPPTDGDDGPPKPQKLKIDIPDSPFEPDVNQVKDQLKHLLNQWKTREYPSDEIRWKLYYKDILKLLSTLEGEVK